VHVRGGGLWSTVTDYWGGMREKRVPQAKRKARFPTSIAAAVVQNYLENYTLVHGERSTFHFREAREREEGGVFQLLEHPSMARGGGIERTR